MQWGKQSMNGKWESLWKTVSYFLHTCQFTKLHVSVLTWPLFEGFQGGLKCSVIHIVPHNRYRDYAVTIFWGLSENVHECKILCACHTCEAPQPPLWRSSGNSSHCRQMRLEERPAQSVPRTGPDWIQKPHWAGAPHSDLQEMRGWNVSFYSFETHLTVFTVQVFIRNLYKTFDEIQLQNDFLLSEVMWQTTSFLFFALNVASLWPRKCRL